MAILKSQERRVIGCLVLDKNNATRPAYGSLIWASCGKNAKSSINQKVLSSFQGINLVIELNKNDLLFDAVIKCRRILLF